MARCQGLPATNQRKAEACTTGNSLRSRSASGLSARRQNPVWGANVRHIIQKAPSPSCNSPPHTGQTGGRKSPFISLRIDIAENRNAFAFGTFDHPVENPAHRLASPGQRSPRLDLQQQGRQILAPYPIDGRGRGSQHAPPGTVRAGRRPGRWPHGAASRDRGDATTGSGAVHRADRRTLSARRAC